MKRMGRAAAAGVLLALFLPAVFFSRLVFGEYIPTARAAARYTVRGVDVSAYQGEIDWTALARQQLSFAYIKATEGSGWVDSRFAANWAGAQAAGLRVGAYHFLSYDSAGSSQADNFLAAVPRTPGMLPPAIDVEFYGDYIAAPPTYAQAHAVLDVLVARLTAACGVRPVLYATRRSYALYLRADDCGCAVWIRDVAAVPALPDGRPWAFWQYSARGFLPGYSGEERYIDLDVFCGTAAEFAAFGQVHAVNKKRPGDLPGRLFYGGGSAYSVSRMAAVTDSSSRPYSCSRSAIEPDWPN